MWLRFNSYIYTQIRDTSVLVRMRPSWEELRRYLTAKGRKRFEVYVCTMAERDYALEMWRLLDPEGNLINTNDLLARIVCVKPGKLFINLYSCLLFVMVPYLTKLVINYTTGLKKSLFNVFLDRTCHPKMALVIDDRLKVWDEKDQARVHVVPAFAPYYSPQAEVSINLLWSKSVMKFAESCKSDKNICIQRILHHIEGNKSKP